MIPASSPADRNLTSEVPADILETGQSRQVFTIQIAGNWYGLPIEAVRTVFRINAITPVPMAPPAIAGLVNVRGEVLTAVHVAMYLGLEAQEPQQNYLLVGIEHFHEAYGLIVDKAGEILDVEERARIVMPTPRSGSSDLTTLPTYKVGDLLLPLLDVDTMLKSISATHKNISVSRKNLSA